jgi:hypothetical protein
MGLGLAVAVISLVLALNGWPASRMWFYYLMSAMLFLVGMQFLISWILMRVLEELSRRDALAAQDLEPERPVEWSTARLPVDYRRSATPTV